MQSGSESEVADYFMVWIKFDTIFSERFEITLASIIGISKAEMDYFAVPVINPIFRCP
jgi:hypothetical protein